MLVSLFIAQEERAYAVSSTAGADISVSDIVELFIRLEIIPSDKAEQARSIYKERLAEVEKKEYSHSCVTLTKNLYMGVSDKESGGEVSKLQKFLMETGDFTYPKVTGYYGPATEMAVQSWQAKMRIVTSGSPDTNGYGVVGPMTRAKMYCADGRVQEIEKNEIVDEKKDDANVSKESTVRSITVSTSAGSDKVYWTVKGASPEGYKIVWSKNSRPLYPTRKGDKFVYVTGTGDGRKVLSAFDGSGRYFVRVCEYTGGKCGVYSNEVTLELTADDAVDEKVEDKVSESVTKIQLSGSDRESAFVSWVTTGVSNGGYKVVWSKNQNPTYPTRSGDKYLYFSDSKVDSTTLDGFDGDGRYFVRVCEYTGGKCGTYSNEIVVSL